MLNIESKMEGFARTYARDTGIHIKMGANFCTDGKTIYIVPVTDQHDPWIRFMTEVICYHETGHLKTGDVAAFKSITDATKRHIFNVVRDVVVENVMETEYKGLKDKWVEFLTKFMKKNNYNDQPALQAVLGMLYLKGREQLLGINLGVKLAPALQEIFDKRLAKFVDPICNHTDIKTSLSLTEEIYDAIKEEAAPKPQPQPDQSKGQPQPDDQGAGGDDQDASDSSGESGSDEGDESEEGVSDQVSPDVHDDTDGGTEEGGGSESDDDVPDGEDNGVGSGGSDEGDEDDEPGTGDGKSEQSGVGDDGDAPVDGDEGGNGAGGGLSDEAEEALKEVQEQADEQGDKETLTEQAVKQINKYASTHHVYRTEAGLKEKFYKQDPWKGWETIVARHETEGRQMVGILGGKLKRLFISERAPIKVHNLRSGKLDVRKLYKLRTGARDICWRKTTGTFEDAAVYEVIDNSSSMRDGEKDRIAQGILTAVSNDLDKLRIPFGAVGFTSDGEGGMDGVRRVPCYLNQIKGFEEPYRRVRHRFVWPTKSNGTVELPAIQYAAQQLALRRETKKVLFILTDGETGSGNDVLDSALRVATKEFIDRLIRAGVKVVGIGIVDEHIADYCTDFIHVRDLSKFASEFYQKLTKLLT